MAANVAWVKMASLRGANICVHACVIREIKHPFQDMVSSLNHAYVIYTLNHLNLCQVGLSFCFKMHR